MTDPAVEKVAKAIAETFNNWEGGEFSTEYSRDYWRARATAAIAAYEGELKREVERLRAEARAMKGEILYWREQETEHDR